MRTDILDLHHFYESPLGALAAASVAAPIKAAWGEAAGLRVAGFGFAAPYLAQFPHARATLALAPDAQGVMRWPTHDDRQPASNDEMTEDAPSPPPHTPGPIKNRACLVHEGYWPLPDRSVDRLLIVHGLEEVRDATRLLREVWRVLADDGHLIIVAAQRRGLWAAFDTTPMAAGRPWLRGQLNRLLEQSLFAPRTWHRALNFPPISHNLAYRMAPSLDRIGKMVWPGFCGALVVEAEKNVIQPVKGTPARVQRVARPKLSARFAPRPASVSAANSAPNSASGRGHDPTRIFRSPGEDK
ncbi:MAG: methyltransferase domain-containing protein [Pseudomonadota bacterium]